MKIVILAHIIALVFYSCGLITSNDDVKPFIPGVYARHYSDEYTNSYDTIIIQEITSGGSEGYSVVKRSRVDKVGDDGTKMPGYELKKWTGVYDDKSKTIWLQTAGKSIWFDPAKGELKLGAEPYKKIK